MIHHKVLCIAAATCALILTACGGQEVSSDPAEDEQAEQDPRVQEILALEGDAGAGEEIYAEECAYCHMPSGRGVDDGGSGKNLVRWLGDHSVEAAILPILDGRRPYMLAYEGYLSSQQIADVAAYLDEAFVPSR